MPVPILPTEFFVSDIFSESVTALSDVVAVMPALASFASTESILPLLLAVACAAVAAAFALLAASFTDFNALAVGAVVVDVLTDESVSRTIPAADVVAAGSDEFVTPVTWPRVSTVMPVSHVDDLFMAVCDGCV